MPDVIVIGDGPGGLSAALLLAKRGRSVVVLGKDGTAMHWAMLYNYLGIPEIHGSAFQEIARQQVTDHGATLHDDEVTEVTRDEAVFTVTTASGDRMSARHLVLSEGKTPKLARSLGVDEADGRVTVDRNGRTSIDRLYAVGRMVRPTRSQAIISAGDGAAAALDILSELEGKDVQDWDSPPKD
jgi:thioredoxin reductase